MKYEIWLSNEDEVWSDLIYSTTEEWEARHAYDQFCAEYGEENIDVFKVDEHDCVFAIEFI